MSRKSRSLSADERALWEAVIRDAAPLRLQARKPKHPPARAAGRAPDKSVVESIARKPNTELRPTEPDRKVARALRRGKLPIERKIDLHGLTQAAAHRLLQKAVMDGAARRLLVVTGRGSAKTDGGILRRMLPLWLAEPPFSTRVLAVGTAGPEHGGQGAYYVLLRRARS